MVYLVESFRRDEFGEIDLASHETVGLFHRLEDALIRACVLSGRNHVRYCFGEPTTSFESDGENVVSQVVGMNIE